MRFANTRAPVSLLWFALGGGVMFAVIQGPSLAGLRLDLWQTAPLLVIGASAFLLIMIATRQVSFSELRMMLHAVNPARAIRYALRELRVTDDAD